MTTLETPPLFRWGMVCAAALLSLPSGSRAEEINWRSNYQQAWEEVQRTGRPLLIDLGSENCYWCKQLDARTFRDPEIVTLLNQRFVTLRLSGDGAAYLVKALRVQSYPTLVVSDSAGKIVRYQEGFLEPAPLKDLLVKALVSVAVPDWMARDHEEAVKAAASDPARALSLLRNILEDGKERPVQVKARAVLQKLEGEAAERLTAARVASDKGDLEKARTLYGDLVARYPATPASREARSALANLSGTQGDKGPEDRSRRAKELFKRAEEAYRGQQFLTCLDQCEEVSRRFGDLPEGAQALKLADDVKGNPEWTKLACEQLSDRLCLLYLSLADVWLKKGQPQLATHYLERVVKSFPSSPHAAVAQVKLTRLQGAPADGKH